jgi:hypothetical protein
MAASHLLLRILLLLLPGGEVSYAEHIAPLRAAARPELRCVLVSATLPQHTFDELQELFMGLGAAFGPGLHRTATGAAAALIVFLGLHKAPVVSSDTGLCKEFAPYSSR